MKVLIINSKDGKMVASIPINLGGLNYSPTKEEYYAEAWKHAVEDGGVDENRRGEYKFALQE